MSSESELVGIRSSLYKPLDPNGVKQMAEAVFEVLETSGVAVYSDEAFEAFANAGAVVDRETRTVKLPRTLVEDCIDSNPSTITLHARNEKYDAVLEKDRVHYGTGGTAIFVLDPDTGERRPSTVDDVILNARMVDAARDTSTSSPSTSSPTRSRTRTTSMSTGSSTPLTTPQSTSWAASTRSRAAGTWSRWRRRSRAAPTPCGQSPSFPSSPLSSAPSRSTRSTAT